MKTVSMVPAARFGPLRIVAISFGAAIILTLSAAADCLAGTGAARATDIRVYSYVSPSASKVLLGFKMTEAELESHVREGLASRSIRGIGGGQLYEGSEDALRIDIRRKKKNLLIELSVRQGGSIHNMLERWSNRRLIAADSKLPEKQFRDSLFKTIESLLDELKYRYGSQQYVKGHMIPEDYQAEKDE